MTICFIKSVFIFHFFPYISENPSPNVASKNTSHVFKSLNAFFQYLGFFKLILHCLNSISGNCSGILPKVLLYVKIATFASLNRFAPLYYYSYAVKYALLLQYAINKNIKQKKILFSSIWWTPKKDI